MSYAAQRRIIDADSHVIELDDFLDVDSRPEFRDRIPTIFEQKNLPVEEENLRLGRELFKKRHDDPAVMKEFEADLLDNTKRGWQRLGAFDPSERSHTLDLLGFQMAAGVANTRLSPGRPHQGERRARSRRAPAEQSHGRFLSAR